MATDSMFLRLVGGNVANPTLTDNKISAHTFIAALQMVANGEITKAQMVAQYDLTHLDDSADLDNFISWYSSANNREQFANVLEWRIILARDKRTAVGGVDMDGAFGFAIKNKLLDGADGSHSFNPAAGIETAQFNKWTKKDFRTEGDLEVVGRGNFFPLETGTVQILDLLAANAAYVQFRIGTSAARSAAAVWQEAEGRFAFNTSVLNFPILFNNGALFVDRLATGKVGVNVTAPGAQFDVASVGTDQVVKLQRKNSRIGSGFIYANVDEMFGVNDGTRYPFMVRQLAPTNSLVIEANGQVTTGGKVVVGEAILPAATKVYDLGSATKRFRDLYLAAGTLFLGEETLKVNSDGALEFSGAGGVATPASDPEWLDLTRASANQSGIVTGTDIIMDFSRGNGIAYNKTTGIVSLKTGFTYRLFATFAVFSIQSNDTVAIEWVKASDNVKLAAAHETRIRPANASSNGCNANTIEIIYKPTVDTDVKLRCTEYTGSPDAVTMYWERSMATVIRLR